MKKNDSKRPMSSKPSNTRPTTGKPSVIKTDDTQVETITNKNKNTNQNYTEDEKISESIEDNISNSKINNKSRSTIDKMDFLDSLAKGSRRDSFINLLDEEAQRIDKINEKKQKLDFITLKENDIEGLYEWKTLFNNSRPLSHYTRINYKKPVLTEVTDINDIRSPKVLVDLPDDKMLLFFGKNAFENDNDNKKKKKSSSFRKKITTNYNISNTISNEATQTLKSNRSNTRFIASSKMKTSRSNKTAKKENNSKNEKGHNYIKPMSIYAKFNPEDTFYFSNTFSDYYKEDLKSFTNKMPILKAKIKTNSNRLKRAINKQRIKSSLKEKQLYDLLTKDSLVLKKQDLIISAERKNPLPLMKSIYHQENPEAEEIKEHVKKYFKTMKPLGDDDGKTDYTQNDRWRLNKELVKYNKGKYNEENKNDYYIGKRKKRKLILSYYNINDPDIQLFNNLNVNEDKMNYSFECKNDNKILEEQYKSKSTEIFEEVKKDIENSNNIDENKFINLKTEEKKENTIHSSIKQRPRTGFKQSRDINILNNEMLKKPSVLIRPHSSNVRRKNLLTEKIFDLKDYNELYKDYMPSNRFPLKTSSKVKNSSYNKMNEMIKERHLIKKYSKDYFMTQPGNMHLETYINENYDKKRRIRPGTAGGERGRNRMKANLGSSNENSKISKSNQKCNILFFNQYIDMNHDLDLPCKRSQFKGYFSPMNCFNKLAGKYYSSSNNVHVKNKRNKKKEILNNYYGNYGNIFAKNHKSKFYF